MSKKKPETTSKGDKGNKGNKEDKEDKEDKKDKKDKKASNREEQKSDNKGTAEKLFKDADYENFEPQEEAEESNKAILKLGS